jgi:two-component system, NarL family, response regulator DevR
MAKTKVFLAEPQVLFREGIHFILSGEEDIDVIGETTSNEEALSLIESNPPDVAVLNLSDAKISGTECAKRIRRYLPSVFVVLTIEKKEPDKVFEAMKSGASACLSKFSSPDQLLDIIKAVAQGSLPIIEDIFDPAIASLVLNEFADITELNKQFDNSLANLTPREVQIINLIASGNNLEQTALRINLDEDAVRHSVRIILAKLIANEQTTTILETAQKNLNFLLRPARGENTSRSYVTKAEFNEFKEILMERFQSFIGDLAPSPRTKK